MTKLSVLALSSLLLAGCVSQPVASPSATIGISPLRPQTQASIVATQIISTVQTVPQAVLTSSTVGHISRHAQNFVGKTVQIEGYILKKESGYVIVSDEDGGAVGYYDLPVVGTGLEFTQYHQKYTFQGVLISGGLTASNGNPYHLALTIPPQKTAS